MSWPSRLRPSVPSRNSRVSPKAYLSESKADMVVANNVSGGDAFGSDYNELLVVTKGRTVRLARDLKTNLAKRLLDEVATEIGKERKRVKASPRAGKLAN